MSQGESASGPSTAARLHSQASRTSIQSQDSGLGTNDLSRNSSVTSLGTSAHDREGLSCEPPQSLEEHRHWESNDVISQTKDKGTNIVTNTVDGSAEDCPVKIMVHGDLSPDVKHPRSILKNDDSNNLLTIPRKHSGASTASITSDEYLTPPTTPTPLSRSMSMESSSSCASQEMRIQMEIHSPTSNEKLRVKARTKIPRTKGDFYLTIHIPSLSENLRRRHKSSPASSPTSPAMGQNLSLMFHQGLPSPLLRRNEVRSPQDILTSPTEPAHVEKIQDCSADDYIADIVKRNMSEFTKSTDMESLFPCLFQTSLISTKDWEDLQKFTNSKAKMNFFYIFLLSSKGPGAYEKLFECLKDERDHRGHQHLVRIIEREIAALPGQIL